MMFRTASAALFLVLCSSCGVSGGQGTVTILHTNDMHGSFLPREAAWVKTQPRPMVGGFNELTARVDSIREVQPGALLFDAGDVMTGNPICDMEYRGAQGGLLFAMMNRIGYDLWCPGNHDLDISRENLGFLSAVAEFPTVSANLVNDAGEVLPGNRAYVILEREGLRIGVIGIMSQQLYSLVNQNSLAGLRVLSPAETVRRLVEELDPQTDLLIALTHQGFDEDSAMAEEVTGLDLIIGGHSHTRLRPPRVVNSVIIAQAGANCENLGVLELTVRDDRIASHRGSLLPLMAGERHTRLTDMIDSIRTEIDREYSEVIAELQEDWRRAEGESNIGNFILEAQREAAGAQISFINTGGIRRDVPAGPLTRRQLYEVLPFRNIVAAFQLSGRQLREVLTHHLTQKPGIQISGLTCRWRQTAGGGVEILDLRVGSTPVEESTMYVCAASDYFLGEAARYLGTTIERPIMLRTTLFDAALNAARRTKTIVSVIENRIQEVKR